MGLVLTDAVPFGVAAVLAVVVAPGTPGPGSAEAPVSLRSTTTLSTTTTRRKTPVSASSTRTQVARLDRGAVARWSPIDSFPCLSVGRAPDR